MRRNLPVDKLLTEAEAAKAIGYSIPWARKRRKFDRALAAEGKPILGPSWLKMPNGAVRYHPDDLDDWLERANTPEIPAEAHTG